MDVSKYITRKSEKQPPIATASAVADRFPYPCTFMGGWWRTRAVCHDSDGSHTLAFRDPEKEGASLAVHCHQPACSADHDGVRHAIQKATGLRVCACPACQGQEFPDPPPIRKDKKRRMSNGKVKQPKATPVLKTHWGAHLFPKNWIGKPAGSTVCPQCGATGAVQAEGIHDHPFPYMSLVCTCDCDLPYDTLHKHVISRLPANLSWRQEAHYILTDENVRPHLRFDSPARQKLQYWSNGEKCEHAGRPVKGRQLLRWAKEPRAAPPYLSIVVEGEKAAAAIVSTGADWTSRVFSAGDAAGLESCEWVHLLGGMEVMLWPDKDAAGLKGMAALGNRIANEGGSVSVIDVERIPTGRMPPTLPPR